MKTESRPHGKTHRYILSREERLENVWSLLKHICWGVFLAFGVASGSQIVQLILGDIFACTFLILVMAAVLIKGWKLWSNVGPDFPNEKVPPTDRRGFFSATLTAPESSQTCQLPKGTWDCSGAAVNFLRAPSVNLAG